MVSGPSGLAGRLSLRFSFNPAIKTAKIAKCGWRAALTAGFPFQQHGHTFGDPKCGT
jgi:hypothetical protein